MMFKDVSFRERTRGITFDGDPVAFTRLFDQPSFTIVNTRLRTRLFPK